ncbi:MAG: hypothetical protein JW913_01105 [Chitinispirillaceae bacterium]|nr:hypothetical protein [Chitinispirillaceae bacterium]
MIIERRFHLPSFPSRGSFLALLFFSSAGSSLSAEPVVVLGEQFPELLGRPVERMRMCDNAGNAIPFQIDEVTADGEYVCDRGEAANGDSGNGLLDLQDEIVVLREDCPPCEETTRAAIAARKQGGRVFQRLMIDTGWQCRAAWLTDDTSIALSTVSYITYDHSRRLLRTPAYFAQFGEKRFHFIRAGIRSGGDTGWIDLTKELRVEIFLSALWGILPIHYTEDNLICFVKRYKAGPVRLIRRGDFHLRLGFGIKGSRAAVNQLCYPQMVRVPVKVHLPVRFKHFFREAWLEMSPVIDRAGLPFVFSIHGSQCTFTAGVAGNAPLDTLLQCSPDGTPFTFLNGTHGFGWLLTTDLPATSENGSGFVFRRPSSRTGNTDCGYRLMIHDVPRGRYDITNWVVFSSGAAGGVGQALQRITNPALVSTTTGHARNRLVEEAAAKTGSSKSR